MKRLLLGAIGLLFGVAAVAQEPAIPFNGELLDGTGVPIRSARIYVRSERDYALTDRQGHFGLTNVQAQDTLFILIKKRLYTVPVEGRKSIRIFLPDERDAIHAEEVPEFMSIGYGFVARRERTSASNYISGEELRRTGQHNILQALQGRVPGLNIVGQGESTFVNMRGMRSFRGPSAPLFVIDGVIVPSLDGYSVSDVDYIEVMKEGSIYGSQGANGAILIHTKRQ